jgi:hypothetical protein
MVARVSLGAARRPRARDAQGRAVTVNDRVHECAFAYDADNPPSVEEGLPLSAARTPREEREPSATPRSLMRSCRHAVAALAARRRD